MSTFAMGGLIGGLAFGLVDYFVLLPLVTRPLTARLETLVEPERSQAERRLTVLRYLFMAQIVVFPILGYILGSFLDRSA